MNRTLHIRIDLNPDDIEPVFESLEHLRLYLEKSIREELSNNDIRCNVVSRIEKL